MSQCETRNDIDPLAAAREQLEVAIDLFLSEKSYISALTLAGAACGVFETHLKVRGEKSMVDVSFEAMDYTQQLAPWFGDVKHSLPKHERFKAFRKRQDLERNLFKHGPDKRHDNRYQRPRMHLELQDAAYKMILRADVDRESLGVPETSNCDSFHEWFYENVVGV
jgi:hypothetical protein